VPESRHGVAGTIHQEVFFTEIEIPGAVPAAHIRVEISRQNANLSQVKDRMAKEARAKGSSAIQKFRYGQRAHKWWEQALTFKWDTESWYGEGEACKPPPAVPPKDG
jgi:hypothetical protein